MMLFSMILAEYELVDYCESCTQRKPVLCSRWRWM